MTAQHHDEAANPRREYILAEFRCALMRAKLVQLDLEAFALALKHGIVTPDQAVAMLWDSEAVHFLRSEAAEPGSVPDAREGGRA